MALFILQQFFALTVPTNEFTAIDSPAGEDVVQEDEDHQGGHVVSPDGVVEQGPDDLFRSFVP